MLHKYAIIYFSDTKLQKQNKLYTDTDLWALCKTLEKVMWTQDLSSILQAAKIVLFLEDEALLKKVKVYLKLNN